MVDENSLAEHIDHQMSSPLSSSPTSSTTSSSSSSSQASISNSDTNSTNLTPSDYSSDEESVPATRRHRMNTSDDNEINELISKASDKLSKQHTNGHHSNNRLDTDQMNRFFELMKSERNRLTSFTVRPDSKWSLEHVIPARSMARAGFFYLNADRVQCAFCRGVIRNWDSGLRPLAEHARHFYRCPFIMEEDVGNIPIDTDPIRGPQYVYGHDVCGSRDISPTDSYSSVRNNRNNSVTTSATITTTTTTEQNNYMNVCKTQAKKRSNDGNTVPLINIKEYGIQPYSGPKNISMSSADARLQSFMTRGWDNSVPVSVDKLVEAGFYYIGRNDAVMCFYCNGGLMSWVKGDDPWVEHAKKLPICHFLQLNKGQNFIDECQRLEAIDRQSQQNNNSAQENGAENHATIEGNGDDEDIRACNVVDQWMNASPLVNQLSESFSAEVIKSTLNQRYHTHRRMFDTFGELYDAVKQSSERPNVFNVISLTPPDNNSPECSPSSVSTSPLSEPLSTPLSDLTIDKSKQATTTGDLPENRLQCKLCYANEIGVVFLPCGHQLACIECAQRVYECPICRKQLRGFVKTFFS